MAQVNVEKLRSGGIDDGFSGSAGLTSAFSTGNIQLADIGPSASKAYKREHHTIFSVLNGALRPSVPSRTRKPIPRPACGTKTRASRMPRWPTSATTTA